MLVATANDTARRRALRGAVATRCPRSSAITTYCTLPLTATELTQHGVQVHTIAKDLFQRQAPFEVYEEVKAKGLRLMRW